MPTATGPNGEKLTLENGQWVPVTDPTGIAGALPGKPTAQGAQMDSEIRSGMKTAAGELVANVIGLPHAAGELLALGGAALRTGAGAASAALKGEPINLAERFSNARVIEEGSRPAKTLLAAPEPSSADVLNAVGLEETGGTIATGAGKAAADVATLMTLRPSARVTEILKMRRGPTAAVDPETLSSLNRAARVLTAGSAKVAEAGFEGAVVGALGEGDPAVTSAWSAGIQLGGSAALTAKAQFFKNPLKTFGTLFIGHEMYKAIAPGPQNAFDSKDEVIDEMVVAYGLGLAASLAGANRGTEMQRVVNAVSHASRIGVASVITQLDAAAQRGDTQYERIVAKISSDPDYFGDTVRRRLERAANSEKPNELLREIDSLMQTASFREDYESMSKYRTGGEF
jgi:hypothetical protein